MKGNSRNAAFGGPGVRHPFSGGLKWLAATVIAVVMVMGVTGCALDDLTSSFAGDVPFAQEQTTPPEMGAVDHQPTVADDAAFEDIDSHPLPPMN